jgi:uncharacterized membrane protein
VVLLLASALGCGLVAMRVLASWQWKYGFLVFNLLLAWLPVFFALAVTRLHQRGETRRFRFWFCALLWLLFLPNAPYIVTDFVHLKERAPVPLWFDILTLMNFAWTGVLLGFVALYLVHRIVAAEWGAVRGWLFVAVMLGLTGLGVYVGRFLRWNSWDFLISPLDVTIDIVQIFSRPGNRRGPFVFTTVVSLFCTLAYLALYCLAHSKGRLREPAPGSKPGADFKSPP